MITCPFWRTVKLFLLAAHFVVEPAIVESRKLAREHVVGGQVLPKVAICVIHKDQNEDVAEWVDYHLGLGVSKIFFFDHNSSVTTRNMLTRYGNVVHFEEVSTVEAAPLNAQQYVYKKCLTYKDVQWMAFIDIDEFIVLKSTVHTSLPAFMTDYADMGALAVNWVMFGSNGHVKRPAGQHTLNAYTRCIQPHPTRTEHIKSIVNMAFVTEPGGEPHHFHYVDGKTAVNENCIPVVDTPFTEGATVTKIALHHYALKSLEEYSRKMKRGGGDGNLRPLEWFITVDSAATALCLPGTQFSGIYD